MCLAMATQVQLSAGAFTGAAMFVQCIVASEVLAMSGCCCTQNRPVQ